MRRQNWIYLLLLSLLVIGSCEDASDEIVPDTSLTEKEAPQDTTSSANPDRNPPSSNYFPPAAGTWETLNQDSAGLTSAILDPLYNFLSTSNTYGFIVLYKGRIVAEKYWNNWTPETKYFIASAGKSITSLLVGVAQDEKLLNINNPTSSVLGEGWTSMSTAKEKMIRIKHHLSMTTGLDESNDQCTTPGCLSYRADAGKRWAYHNGAYNLLHAMIEKSSGMSMDEFTKTRLADKIGMKNWRWEDFNLELSTRDMARFGLLVLNKGAWNGKQILKNAGYFQSMISSSNGQNKSYGYLWWLNGKDTYMVPAENDVKKGPLTPHAPKSMFAAMGKGDKKIYVLPAQEIVVVRHGDDAGTSTFGPSSFDSDLWQHLMPMVEALTGKGQ